MPSPNPFNIFRCKTAIVGAALCFLACLLPTLAWAAGTADSAPLSWVVLYAIVATFAGLVLTASLWGRVRQLGADLQRKTDDLVRSAYEWNQAMDFLEDPMYLVDLNDRLVRANRAFYQQVGKSPEQALGLDVRTLIHLKPEKIPCPACAARLEQRDAFFTKEANDPTNPTGRPIEVTIRVIRDQLGQPVGMLQGLRDMTHLRAAEEALFREKERAEVTLKSIGDAVLTTDAGGLVNYLNPAAERLLGQGLAKVTGRCHAEVLNIIDEGSREPVANPIERCLARKSAIRVSDQTLIVDAQGNEYAVDIIAAPILDRDGACIGAVLAMHDVSVIRGVTRQLNYQATHDVLTGLINRREFDVRLRQVMESSRVDNTRHSLIFMDLDRFKIVNDTCGHAAGDELLKEVSALFTKQFRNVDILARLGGDEFAVLLECCPVEAAERIGGELIEKLGEYRLAWDGKRFEVGVSMGLVEIDAESSNIADIMAAADSACYNAKHSGRNRISRYLSDDMEMARHQGQAQWAQRITHALEANRFVLYCQAIQKLDALDGPFEHYEILLRLLDDEGQIVPPNDFIPAAERFDMMPAIDRWVVSKTFDMLAGNNLRVADGVVWSINLSGQSLGDESFHDFVLARLDETGIDAAQVCFEITETAAVSSFSHACKFIAALRQRGVQFALDDFGSGLSSFAYLKNLHVDYLKIDGGFVKDMVKDPLSYSLVRSIQDVGQTMGMQTIAEFVENDAIIDKLRELSVDYAQGYGIGKPKPMTDLLAGQVQQRAS